MTEIENGILSAKIDERGSQLVSVSSIKTGRESRRRKNVYGRLYI